MAMFHFRLKSDKKPNGTKISAVKHVEYINREGTFSDDEQEKESDKYVGNFITTEKSPNALGGQNWIIVNKVDKKLERGEKFRFKIIRGKKIDSRMRTIRIVKSVNILKQGNL